MTMLLSLGTQQNMTISPRMQQAIGLLKLSAVDFELALRTAVGSNPFLDDLEEAVDPEPIESPPSPHESMPLAETYAFERNPPPSSPDDGEPEVARLSARTDLREYLRKQLLASRVSWRQTLAAEAVIEMLDESGYLRDDIDESLKTLSIQPPIEDDDIDAAVTLLRTFDPPGVGARTLVDCLLLQLDAMDPETPGLRLAGTMLSEHIDLLARRDFVTLQRRLSCGGNALDEAIALIRKLDPQPGSQFSAGVPDYIVPDVLVVEQGGQYSAVLNPGTRGEARLNQRYVELFRECRRSQHPAMAQQLQEARWMVRNVEQRYETILRVANFIVKQQQAYFSAGDIALKPMILREVANALDLHESTVSRATNNKFMATANGCVPFKHFFSRELDMNYGGRCSAAAVRSLIGGLISGERQKAPLSDVQITAELKAQGICIARRTVTKYRRMLKVPSAEFRRVG